MKKSPPPVAPVNLGVDRNTVTQPQPEDQELLLGDVLRSSGSGKDYIVDMVNATRCCCTPLNPEHVRYERTDGSVCEYSSFVPLSIPVKSKVVLIERRGVDGLAKFIALKVARRELEVNIGNNTTRTRTMKTDKHDATGLPVQPFDRACCEELLKGGTPEQIADRVAARFTGEKDAFTRNYRTNPKNYLKYHADYVKEMTAAGLLKGVAAVAHSASKAAPAVVSAPVAPVVTRLTPVGKPGAVLKPLAKAGKAKTAVAKALAFVSAGRSKPTKIIKSKGGAFASLLPKVG